MTPEPSCNAVKLYIDLLKRSLVRATTASPRERHTLVPTKLTLRAFMGVARKAMAKRGLELVRVCSVEPEAFLEPTHESRNRVEAADTMVGLKQLDNVEACVLGALSAGIPGDLLEAGVWRGGVSILMRGILRAYGDESRSVWVVDSFAGLPEIDRARETEEWSAGDMTATLEVVKANFARYGLLDDRVQFLKGFFADTLPMAPIGKLAVLRIDADLYSSTKDALTHLYPKLSIGGFILLDDYQNLADCRRAVDEYRSDNRITETIVPIDKNAVYWKRLA